MRPSKKVLYRLLSLQGISMLGSRLSSIAVGIWFVKETGTVTPLLLIALFTELPLLFFGAWIGLAVDRWRRKTAIIIGDTGQAVCTALLAFSLLSGYFELWHTYAVAAMQGLFMAMQSSSTAAVMPLMVHDEELDRVNAVKELLFPLAGVIAPLLAGTLYELVGLAGIVMIDIGTFFICVGVTLFLPLPEINHRPVERVVNVFIEAIQGYRFIWKNKPILYLMLYFAWWNFILNGPLELAIPFFLYRTGSDSAMSWLLGVMNAGALSGAAAAVWWGHFRHKITFIIAGSLLTSTMFIVVGASRLLWVTAAALFLLMLPLAMTVALFSSLLQRKTPLSMQGRVFAAYSQLSAVSAPLSFLLTGPIIDHWLEPAMQSGRWKWLTVLTGQGAGSGIGLLFIGCGLLLMIGAVWAFSSSCVRHMETSTPDR
ncbi:MFS transporter [Paenibacillus sedimenti]|uniref:MFS transporter n=1 Tax=Paenibacillus sedimenti TaxID=2770274 RepID=A0A926QKX6_9BACL|nr:MFS transporter [Paenibacillus sedimenti]MBD0381972.1 MFS transporter [Paenibacillus sedimenti]